MKLNISIKFVILWCLILKIGLATPNIYFYFYLIHTFQFLGFSFVQGFAHSLLAFYLQCFKIPKVYEKKNLTYFKTQLFRGKAIPRHTRSHFIVATYFFGLLFQLNYNKVLHKVDVILRITLILSQDYLRLSVSYTFLSF